MLEHLAELRPLDDPEIVESIVVTVFALGHLGDRRSATGLRVIMDTPHAHPKVRLAAATALAQTGSARDGELAHRFIVGRYNQKDEFYGMRGAGFEPVDMYRALAAIDTDEAFNILVDTLGDAPQTWETKVIIEYMTTRTDDVAAHALIAVVDNTGYFELPIRLTAMESVIGMSDDLSDDELMSRIRSLLSEAIEEGWPASEVKRARSVMARIDRTDVSGLNGL